MRHVFIATVATLALTGGFASAACSAAQDAECGGSCTSGGCVLLDSTPYATWALARTQYENNEVTATITIVGDVTTGATDGYLLEYGGVLKGSDNNTPDQAFTWAHEEYSLGFAKSWNISNLNIIAPPGVTYNRLFDFLGATAGTIGDYRIDNVNITVLTEGVTAIKSTDQLSLSISNTIIRNCSLGVVVDTLYENPQGTVSFSSVDFQADTYGIAVAVVDSSLTITDSTIEGGSEAGIYVDLGGVTTAQVTITDNTVRFTNTSTPGGAAFLIDFTGFVGNYVAITLADNDADGVVARGEFIYSLQVNTADLNTTAPFFLLGDVCLPDSIDPVNSSSLNITGDALLNFTLGGLFAANGETFERSAFVPGVGATYGDEETCLDGCGYGECSADLDEEAIGDDSSETDEGVSFTPADSELVASRQLIVGVGSAAVGVGAAALFFATRTGAGAAALVGSKVAPSGGHEPLVHHEEGEGEGWTPQVLGSIHDFYGEDQ